MKKGAGKGTELPCTMPGYSLYLVSELGGVRRRFPGKTRFNTPPKGTLSTHGGYLRYKLMHDSGRKGLVFAHHLVLWTFVGPRPSAKYEGCHNDGNPRNNHYKNLRWDTRKGNHADLQTHGTAVKGSRNGRAKLTEEQVVQMRLDYAELVKNGKPYGSISQLQERYGLSANSSFYAVIHKRHWRHV